MSIPEKKTWRKSGLQSRRAATTAFGAGSVQRGMTKDTVSCANYVGSKSIFKYVHYRLSYCWVCHTGEPSEILHVVEQEGADPAIQWRYTALRASNSW